VLTVGEAAEAIADGARRTPGWVGEAVTTAGREQAGDWLRHNVGARDAVLVKASRGAALEHLADVLLDGPTGEREGGNPSR
jgi:UDP-N-acetylmuramoyl-tripeptide--D-alanyl-D-alanine ligase